jgi:ElaB/YqjD/DUF883 family membrane-anchored ribosome-binding protein
MGIPSTEPSLFLGRRSAAHVDLPQGIRCKSGEAAVDPNQVMLRLLRLGFASPKKRANTMFRSGGLGDELQALKSEMSRLLHVSTDDMLDAAKSESEALVGQIKAALGEFGETLSQEEEHVEKLIAERPIAALASAFALGIAIGYMLRRN